MGKEVVGFVLAGRLMGREVRRDVDADREDSDQADSVLDVCKSVGGISLLWRYWCGHGWPLVVEVKALEAGACCRAEGMKTL